MSQNIVSLHSFFRSAKADYHVQYVPIKLHLLMFKNIGIILILSSIFLLSCGETKPKEDPLLKEREKVYKEVMKIHDEMMMMGKIRGAQSELKKMIASDSTNAAKYQTAYDHLQVADDAMMNWMKQFKNPPENTATKEAIEYLKDQKMKVQKMKDIMVENLDKAKQVAGFPDL